MLGETRYLKRPHPPGKAGIRTSLREVALAMGRGRMDEDVLRWGRNVIERERIQRGNRADTPRKRAELLLGEAQAKVWTPDPVGVEFVPAARLLACDLATKDKDCFATDDCDGRSGLLGAALLSVGIDVVAVGHSYTSDKVVGHVLAAAWLDGAWHYADPTLYQEGLGTVVDFTHEIVLEPFTGTVLCEGRRCLGSLPNTTRQYIQEGTFVGVSGGFRMRAPLVLLGEVDADQVQVRSRQAAERELQKGGSDGGFDRADAEAVGGAVGAAAATVVCAELGPGAAACGYVGNIVGAYVAGALYDAASQFGKAGSYTYGPHMWWEIIRWDVARLHNALALQPSWNLGEAEAALRAVGAKPTPNASYTYYAPYLRKVRADLIGQGAALKARQVAASGPSAGSSSSSSSPSSSSAAPVALAIGAGALALWLL